MQIALTAQLVTVLEDALVNAGHEVEVSSRPNIGEVEHLCGLLGVEVSELFARLEQSDCPAWCHHHPEHDPADHVGDLHAGGITLNLCQSLGEDVKVYLPDDVEEGISPARARAIGAALEEAVRLVEEGSK